MPATDILELAQTGLYDRITGDDWFEGFAIVQEDKGDIEKQISIAVGRVGICILILMGRAWCRRPNIPGPYFDEVEYVIEIAENALINRGDNGTGKTAREAAHRICNLVHQHTPSGLSTCFICAPEAIRLADNPNGATVTYHCTFNIQGGIASS